MSGYALPPHYASHQQQQNPHVYGVGPYGLSNLGESYVKSAPPSYGTTSGAQAGDGALVGPSTNPASLQTSVPDVPSQASVAASEALSGLLQQYPGSFPGATGMYGFQRTGSANPSPIPPYQSHPDQGHLMSQSYQHDHNPAIFSRPAGYAGGGSGYSSDGGGAYEEGNRAGILPLRSMTGGAGERHLAQSAGQRASHHFAMSSAFYAQGSTEGVAAALSMTAGPGYHHTGQGSTEGVSAALSMGIAGGPGTGMFQPPPSGWYAARMDYPLHTQGFAQGHSAYGGPPMDFSYGPGPSGARFPDPGPPIQTTPHKHGPDGSNLFIFHIPNEMTNQSMYELFAPLGKLLSVRIMVEKDTGRSKGYGFVSYDNPESAAAAIKALNGFAVHGKRLKVQHKQTTDQKHPQRSAGRFRPRSDDTSILEGGVVLYGDPSSTSFPEPGPYDTAEGALQNTLPQRAIRHPISGNESSQVSVEHQPAAVISSKTGNLNTQHATNEDGSSISGSQQAATPLKETLLPHLLQTGPQNQESFTGDPFTNNNQESQDQSQGNLDLSHIKNNLPALTRTESDCGH